MKERHRYRKHSIDLELIEVKPGSFRWLYAIDTLHSGRGTEVLHDEPTSRADALMLARLEIDQVERVAAAADATSHGFVARVAAGHVTIVGRYAWGNPGQHATEEPRAAGSRTAGDQAVG